MEKFPIVVRKYFIGGLLFSAPRFLWETTDRSLLPLCNLFLKKALVAAANQKEETLFLIDEDNFSPLALPQKSLSSFRCRPPLAQHYFKQALFELNLQSPKKIPPLSLIVPQESLLSNVLKRFKNVWKKELGIECRIVFPSKTWKLGFAEWDASIQDPLFLLDAFKKGTDKLKPADNNWEHPGYQSLFEKARRGIHLQKRDDLTGRLEEMVLESLSILPLFYGMLSS